jgi:hypothetical protein
MKGKGKLIISTKSERRIKSTIQDTERRNPKEIKTNI